MTQYVRESAAGKSISAYVVMKGSRYVATVQAYYSAGGRVLVNVWQAGAAAERSERAAIRDGHKLKPAEYDSPMGFQEGKAAGFGYDKFNHALSGLYIDGHEMTDHCSRKGAPKPPKGRKTFPRDYAPPKGYSVANWVDGSKRYPDDGAPVHPEIPEGECGYTDCYRAVGLKFLKARGYSVIAAI